MVQTLKELILDEQALGSSVLAKYVKHCDVDEARFLIRARQELLKLEQEPGLVAVMTMQRALRPGEAETEDTPAEENPDKVPYSETDTVLFFREADVVGFRHHDCFEDFSVDSHTYDQAVYLCAAYHACAVPFTFANLPKMLGAKVVCPLGINQVFFDQYIALIRGEKARREAPPPDPGEKPQEYTAGNMRYIIRNILLWNKHAAYIGKMIAHKLLKVEGPPG